MDHKSGMECTCKSSLVLTLKRKGSVNHSCGIHTLIFAQVKYHFQVFCNRFAHMFHSFEHFVIVASDADLASMTPQQRETVQARKSSGAIICTGLSESLGSSKAYRL